MGSWATTVKSNMKSEHNLYLACEDSPQHAFFFCTFSCFCLALLASTVPWLLFLNATNRWLHSALDSAKRVRCGGPTALSYLSCVVKKYRSSLSSIASGYAMHPRPHTCQCTWRMSSVMYEFRDVHKLTFPLVTETYVRTLWESSKPRANVLANNSICVAIVKDILMFLILYSLLRNLWIVIQDSSHSSLQKEMYILTLLSMCANRCSHSIHPPARNNVPCSLS